VRIYPLWAKLLGYGAFCLLILLVPLVVQDDYLLNKLGRYLVFGIVAVALSISWGYTGILNLGQAVSFGLGSYCMAMALKLRTIPIQTGAEGLPDFMVWNNVKSLPWFWEPFHSYAFAIGAGILVPAVLAFILGIFIFRARVTGVYVAIITLALLVVVNLVIIDRQRYTGGFNGLTDLEPLQLFGLTFDPYAVATYYLIAGSLTVALFLGFAVVHSKTGLIMQAIRDDETRVRYFGYDVAAYQIFALCFSAGIAGFAGMLYTLVMAFASPTFLAVPISLSIVIWCAVGGRSSLLGSALGAIIVTGVQGSLSDTPAFLETWTLIMGALFIVVVLFLPRGLISLIDLIPLGRPTPVLPRPTAAASDQTSIPAS
jgi:urea transport system permease protein